MKHIDTDNKIRSNSETIFYCCVDLESLEKNEIDIDFFNLTPNEYYGGYLKANKVDSISLR